MAPEQACVSDLGAGPPDPVRDTGVPPPPAGPFVQKAQVTGPSPLTLWDFGLVMNRGRDLSTLTGRRVALATGQ